MVAYGPIWSGTDQRQPGASASVRCGGDWVLNCGVRMGPQLCDLLGWCACMALLSYSPRAAGLARGGRDRLNFSQTHPARDLVSSVKLGGKQSGCQLKR